MRRIEWIDTAKGIAILLVVLEHTTRIDETYVGVIFTHISLPLFFCLSGCFFKSEISLSLFLKSKITSLIIPTLFFFWGGCLLYFCLQSIGIHFEIPFRWIYVLDIFRPTEEIYCNGVVWFLISLFWVYCIFYMASRFHNYIILLVFSFLLTLSGIKIPYFIDTSITAIPFFYMGTLLKRFNILETCKYDKYLYLIIIIGIIMLVLFSEDNSMRSNRYKNPYLYHITAISGVLAILALCKKIGDVPLLSSLYGKYSLIVLGTHPLLINPIRRFSIMYFDGSSLLTFIGVISMEFLVIPLFVKYFPYCCAQKSIFDLFKHTIQHEK